jgi:hypothetical protein
MGLAPIDEGKLKAARRRFSSASFEHGRVAIKGMRCGGTGQRWRWLGHPE